MCRKIPAHLLNHHQLTYINYHMKRLLLFTLSLLITGALYAQKAPKGNPIKAEAYLAKNELDNAKAEIDVAITVEKQAAKQDTWITRGKIYQALATAGNDDAIKPAMDAYNKAKEMDAESSAAQLLDIQNISQFHGSYFNLASEAYNEEDYENSYNAFNKALMVIPTDSLTIYYGALAAYQSEKFEITLDMYETMIDRNIASQELFGNAIFLAKETLKDNDKALALIKKGQVAYPDYSQFKYDEINIYLSTGRDKEALAQLDQAVKDDPNNSSLHLQLGLFKDNMGYTLMTDKDWDGAREKYGEARGHYERALEIKPEDFIANYNLGVIFVNLAKEHFDLVRDMDISTYNKSGKEITTKGNDIISQAIPYIEKSTELNTDDIDAWKALQQIYTQLKMSDKAEMAFNKVEELEGGE